MRIGVLTTSYPRFEGDVAGVFVRGMARALAARGHTLEVLAPKPAAGEAPLTDPGVTLRWIDYGAGLRTFYGAGVPDNVRRDPRAWPGLLSFPRALLEETRARAQSWDALVSHWALPSALVAGRVRGERPHLAVLHSADVHLMARLPLSGRIAARVGASADELWFASNALRKRFLHLLAPVPRARLASRAHASAMGVELEPPSASRRALRQRLRFDRFTLLSVGRLVPIKGLRHAIDAIGGDAGVELVIAGEGPSQLELARRAAQRRARVRFLGVRTGRDKADLFAAADALVLPSIELSSGRTEGTPTVVLEAARAGLPVVASASGGVAELFDEESAWLVPPADVDALRRALRACALEPGARRSKAAAAREIGEAFTWEVLAPRIEDLLERNLP